MNSERTAKLQRVIGRSCVSCNSIDTCEKTNTVAYLAGSTVVLRNVKTKKEQHVISPSQSNNLRCLSLSICGRYLVTGESGSAPCVRFFELFDEEGRFSGKQISSHPKHSTSITVVKFIPVPTTTLALSIGDADDGQLVVWNFKTGEMVATSKINSQVHSLDFSPDATYFVTVGEKHVKYWTVPTAEKNTIQSRSAILAGRRSSKFIDCVFLDADRVLAVTSDGVLVEFVNKKYVKEYRWDSLEPVCISRAAENIAVGYSCGRVELRSACDLTAVRFLPSPAHLGCDPSTMTSLDDFENQPQDSLPSVRVVCAFPTSGSIVSVHSDRAMYVHSPSGNEWQRLDCQLSHVSAINDILVYPAHLKHLPQGSFITAGADGTVRIWGLGDQNDANGSVPTTNFLSSTLLKVIHVDDGAPLTDSEVDNCEGAVDHGVSSLALAPDGVHLVAGTTSGFISVFDVSLPLVPLVTVVEAHSGPVTSMQFSSDESDSVPFFASGGRDCLIHLFRPYTTQYNHCLTIEDHHSQIVSIQFAKIESYIYLYTCSLDKTIVIRRQDIAQKEVRFERINQIVCPAVVPNIVLSNSSIWMAGHDRKIRSFSLDGSQTGEIEGLAGTQNEKDSHVSSLALDRTGTFAVTTCSDQHIYVVDVKNGRPVASMIGFGCVPAKVVITNDFKRLLVITSEGCIFVWRLSRAIVSRMMNAQLRSAESERTVSPDSLFGSDSATALANSTSDIVENEDSPSTSDFGSSSSLEGHCSTFVLHPAAISDTNSHSLTVHTAHVTRKSASNLFAATESEEPHSQVEDGDSQSDFISRRRSALPQYQTSKSMLNIRDGGVQMMGGPSNGDGMVRIGMDRPTGGRRVRPSWGNQPVTPENEWKPPPGHTVVAHPWSPINHNPGATNENVAGSQYQSTPSRGQARTGIYQYQRGNTEGFSLTPQYQQPRYDSPSGASASAALSQIQAVSRARTGGRSPMRGDSRPMTLSKENGEGMQPRTVWSPAAMTPRRSISSLQSTTASPTGAAASAITRRPDDYTSSQLHLRSRSQSPNHFQLSQQAANMAPSSRELTKDLQRRRDSDMSYTAVSSRMTPASSRSNLRDGEMRKSTDALNKLAAIRSKLHQSSENLRKSSDNLSLAAAADSSLATGRTRSISNLRGGQLEAAGTFDADQKSNRTGYSLAQSRMLARSMGNVSNQDGADGHGATESPGARLQNTIAMLKKASNPDLTNEGLYEEDTTGRLGEKMRRRGAVQKKVERYHPRNARNAARQQTSEESDSNASDASPLNQSINRRGFGAGTNRSISSVESSPRPGMASRRLYEQQRYSNISSPRRTNYLAQKLAGDDMVGPDLGSDDSPRSSVNASDWGSLLEESSDCQQLVKHVQDCCDQYQVQTDKIVHARKMVEGSALNVDQKKIIYSQLDRVTHTAMDKLITAQRSALGEDANGNDYTPIKGQIYNVLKQNRF